MIYTLSLIAILIGSLMPFQAGINAKLTQSLNHPLLGAFISLSVGALLLVVIILVQGANSGGDSHLFRGISELRKIPHIPPSHFLGGVLGALFVSSSIYLIPKMGATALISSFITGQLLGSLLIDHFGLLGLPLRTLQWHRVVGLLFLISGVFLIVRKGS